MEAGKTIKEEGNRKELKPARRIIHAIKYIGRSWAVTYGEFK